MIFFTGIWQYQHGCIWWVMYDTGHPIIQKKQAVWSEDTWKRMSMWGKNIWALSNPYGLVLTAQDHLGHKKKTAQRRGNHGEILPAFLPTVYIYYALWTFWIFPLIQWTSGHFIECTVLTVIVISTWDTNQ